MKNNKLVIALKENKNDIRRKLAIVVGVVAATVVAGIAVNKIREGALDDDTVLLTPNEDGSFTLSELPTE